MRYLERCPICGGQPETVVEASDQTRARFIAFSQAKYAGLMDTWLDRMELAIDRCLDCGHYWYRNQPETSELSAMYEASRPLLQLGHPSRMPTKNMIQEMASFRKMARKGTQPTLLDYGSGFGRWARAASLVGFSVTAYEPSAMRGMETTETDFLWVRDQEKLTLGNYDAINLEQVLEHVPNPLETMLEVRKLCHSESVIRVTVPNILRTPEKNKLWDVWPFDGRVPHFMAPFEHLHGFTPNSLRHLAEHSGYRVEYSMKFVQNYPAAFVRRLISSVIPRIGQTFFLLRPIV